MKLAGFMKFAESLGYRMVTVNELLGFAPNSCTPPEDDILARTLVELEGFDDKDMEYADGDRSYGVYKLQKMLFEMGYLTDGTPVEEMASMQYMDYIALQQKLVDGVFGAGTRSAIMAFQSKRGLPCTGVATLEIQQMIRDEYEYLTGQ